MSSSQLEEILAKTHKLQLLTKKEILFLLNLKEEIHLKRLFKAARDLRYRYFKNKIFLYGFVYFSTWCKNECTFCGYRNLNAFSKRYRKNNDEIRTAVKNLSESGVHLIDLTMGEDPYFHDRVHGFDSLIELIKELKTEIKLPIMVSPGVLSPEDLRKFYDAGVDWYACYQETYNRGLFDRLRVKQSYDKRLSSKYEALQTGLLVEEGILLGVGENLEDIAHSISQMQLLGAQQVRVMSFVPQEGIPLKNLQDTSRTREFIVIAILRLLFPESLIPASLDVDGTEGLEERILAGANVVTSLIPPRSGLNGVAQQCKDIDEGNRTVQGILPVLEKMNLEVASPHEYKAWVNMQKCRQLNNIKQKTGGEYESGSMRR